ncbi:hypothetical protein MRB53_012523 [Persea americana]|uniref:Uncharacterized protein n=1 Tax=Persea americana TaxID=3435 RepID=A0ACC2LYV3_PERAE|nr:hypothetical protein MRB53_012523 [Persea americana]
MSPETAFGIPFSFCESGFLENPDILSLLETPSPSPSPSPDAVSPNSNSGSGEVTRAESAMAERKLRRMLSNRESARRSRMRKQRQLEQLRNEATQLQIQNREMTNRLGLVLYQCHLYWTDNARIRSETVRLRQRLSDLQRILTLMQLHQFNQ